MHPEIADVLSGKSRWAVVQGDCVEVMRSLPEDCANLVFGSPPYTKARLYLEDGIDMGIARDAEEWSAWMLTVYQAAMWICPGLTAMVVEGQTNDFRYDCAPDLLRADLCRAGVCLRKPPIYHRVGIPGSGGPDWLRNDYEPIVCATRGGKLPWSDNTACGSPPKFAPGGAFSNRMQDGKRVGKWLTVRESGQDKRKREFYEPPEKANPGNVISGKAGGGHMGNDLAHENEAPFPEWLAEFFVLSFCPPSGIALDPFVGSGTTIAAALKHGRRGIGIDLRASQVELAKRRISGVTPSLFAG